MPNTFPIRVKILAGLLACMIFIQEVSAQDNPVSRYKRKIQDTLHPFDPDRPYYIVSWKDAIPGSIIIARQLNDHNAVIIVHDSHEIERIKTLAEIVPANDLWKYSPAAEQDIKSVIGKQADFILSANNLHALLDSLHKIRGVEIIAVDNPSRSVVIKTTGKILQNQVIPVKEVIFTDVRHEPNTETGIIGYKRSYHGINAVDYSIPGANGRNIVAGVKEQKMESLDLDLFRRVLPSPLAAGTVSHHATVISSIIGGAGNSFYDGRGIANHCSFFSSSFANLFPDDASTLNTARVSVQNHSYGTVIQQFYGAEAVSYDAQTWQNKNLVHVFSSGNQGTVSPIEGPYAGIPGFANLTGNFKMSKNILTVGAIDNKGNIPAESSAGPLYDGRMAPQLTALGPNGTSDAAAIVSGTISVVQQVYADSNNQDLPPASLVKALLFNNTDDIFRKHVDYKTGYGLLNSYASILALQQKQYDGSVVSQSQQWTKNMVIPANTAQVKLTLCWTDSSSMPNNPKALINDLDLELVQQSTGAIFKPWVLDHFPHKDSLSKQATRGRDSLNTAEQISVELPPEGSYQVRVIGTSVPGSPIPFHVAIRLDTLNTFHFTSPQHTSDVNRDEDPDLDIRWRTFVADTNQAGNLYISYDAGGNWRLVKAGHKLHTNLYQWPISDTTSRALFRMETSFGDFFSKEFVISKVTRMSVDFLCADSFRLSWNKHIYAGAYKLFALVDSPYLKHIMNVTDSFVVLNRNTYNSLVYAVQPELTNSLPAARSVAQDISLQGAGCFYRAFYYTLFNGNKPELILELSAPDYVDSLFFEQVNINGQLLSIQGSAKANPTSFIYKLFINEIFAGTTYWRVRIKLKSGAVVYTETISILTSGKRYIVFYPNPSRLGDPLVYVLQQGVPVDSRLQIFDMTGRMLGDFTELSGTIETAGLPGGMYIFRLVSNTGKLLETGKVVLVR